VGSGKSTLDDGLGLKGHVSALLQVGEGRDARKAEDGVAFQEIK
jgi:hypothetical protein